MFRILDTLAASFRVTICGHDFAIHISKSARSEIGRRAVERASASMTEIDVAALQEYAARASLPPEQEVDPNNTFPATRTYSITWQHLKALVWQRVVVKPQQEFAAQLHACLYCLCLGILDDILAHTEIYLYTDKIMLDIVAAGNGTQRRHENVTTPASKDAAKIPAPHDDNDDTVSFASMAIPFSIGVGVGATIGAVMMALINRR
jgi:hypothetical protein